MPMSHVFTVKINPVLGVHAVEPVYNGPCEVAVVQCIGVGRWFGLGQGYKTRKGDWQPNYFALILY